MPIPTSALTVGPELSWTTWSCTSSSRIATIAATTTDMPIVAHPITRWRAPSSAAIENAAAARTKPAAAPSSSPVRWCVMSSIRYVIHGRYAPTATPIAASVTRPARP